jgi:hypothetical protein
MSTTISKVYTFDMPKFVYVQVQGVEQPTKIRADKVTEQGMSNETVLILHRGTEQVGQFRASSVQGWWIEDDETTKP